MKTLASYSKFELRNISDELLDESLLSYIKKEKEVLKEILLHIAEVDRRRLFLKLGYSSLYAYLTERMGYDGGSAQRRLDAARLSQQVPAVIESIDQGSITLAQVTFLQKSLRQVKAQNISTPKKAQILESLKNKTLAETQVMVCQQLRIEHKEAPKIQHQANESVRLEVTLSKAQWEKLKTMRELLSTSLPGGEWDQVLEYIAGKVIEQKTRIPKSRENNNSQKTFESRSLPKNKSLQSSKRFETQSVEAQRPGNSLKCAVLRRDQCCQFKNSKTGKVCGSKWNLQVDHIQPLWAGGPHELKNLRALCANHNQELYRQQANIRRV